MAATVKLHCARCRSDVVLNIYNVWVVEGLWQDDRSDWLPGLRGLYGWRCNRGHVGEMFTPAENIRALAEGGATVRRDTGTSAVRAAVNLLADDERLAAALESLTEDEQR